MFMADSSVELQCTMAVDGRRRQQILIVAGRMLDVYGAAVEITAGAALAASVERRRSRCHGDARDCRPSDPDCQGRHKRSRHTSL